MRNVELQAHMYEDNFQLSLLKIKGKHLPDRPFPTLLNVTFRLLCKLASRRRIPSNLKLSGFRHQAQFLNECRSDRLRRSFFSSTILMANGKSIEKLTVILRLKIKSTYIRNVFNLN